MSYPPYNDGQYPSTYLPQSQHPSPHPPPQYNSASNVPFQQYGKPPVFSQLIPSYPAYGQQQQQQQQQQYHPHQHPSALQYVSPASTTTTFHPSPNHGNVVTPPAPFIHSPLSQPPVSPHYGGRSTLSSTLATTQTPSSSPPSSYLSGHYSSQFPANPRHQSALQRPPPPPIPPLHLPAPPSPSASEAIPAAVSASPAVPQPVIPTAKPRSPAGGPLKMSGHVPTPAHPRKQLHRQQTQQPAEKLAKPPVDYQVLLLALADEYFDVAHNHGTQMALSNNKVDLEEYYKLVATGLGCLEAVLKNWRLSPRTEALVRLRYARILFEETDNGHEAETALSKGIDLCERNRMLDLKYSMQHLLARMLYRSNPKAALKAMDTMIQDVEAYRHVAWEYSFRLLRVNLSLSSSSHQDFVAAIHNLHRISNLASRNGDKPVAVISAVTEALAHLQHSTGSDSIEQAQRAVAIARSHQLDETIRDIPQISTLIQMVDISCSLLEYDINQSSQKLQIMQNLMDQKLDDSRWRDDGSFSIPLNGNVPASANTSGILHVEGGKLVLTVNWLPQHDLYALCYFLSAITLSAKNSYDGRKAEKFLQEGLRMTRASFETPQCVKESLATAGKRLEWRKVLHCNLLLQQIFLTCARTDWELASQTLKELRQSVEELRDSVPDALRCLMQYATGVIAQGTGDLTTALSAFESPILSLSPSTSKTMRNDPRRDTAILAALNTILILRDESHPSHSGLPSILSAIEPFCQGSPNKYIQAAYYLVCATVQTDSTIQTKQHLQQALQSATAISNSQITCMTLTFMSWKYFRGVVGEQSEKSARAARAMARRANDRLWVTVTDEMLAETLERQGKAEEARNVREEADRVRLSLPPTLKGMPKGAKA